MKAICDACSNEWNLVKEIQEYSEGPRCSECGSFDISTQNSQEGGGVATASEAFRRFREEGDTAVDLVVDGIAGPDRAEELLEKFERLSHYTLMTFEEVEAKIEEAREEAREEVAAEAQAYFNELNDQLDAEYSAGYDEGFADGYETGKEERPEEIEAQEV